MRPQDVKVFRNPVVFTAAMYRERTTLEDEKFILNIMGIILGLIVPVLPQMLVKFVSTVTPAYNDVQST